MMKVAVFCVCPDAKQRAHLALVWSTWEAYARRHALELFVLRHFPRPDHPYWGKYFPLELPEFDRFDAALVLDNDVVINPESPCILEAWDGRRVLIGDEREQFNWSRDYVRAYFADYELTIPPHVAEPRVHNTGVLLYTREHLPFFRETHERWRTWRDAATPEARTQDAFKYANDQPHVGLAIQVAGLAQRLDMKFNRLWWSWWQDGGRRAEWPFKIYAKSSKILTRWLPGALTHPLAASGLAQIDRALADNYFLHFAGSKSPLYFLAHRPNRIAPPVAEPSAAA